ncbi:MFS transporter [Candidatus Borrarchaeum sp.]|uniref:MFS transporter n=1 Tax=Candidatus Borrarchaeum sp. TaxID=2846742 RepID=UPI00258105FD|nr:MFS transporter [Candidatus Borrarchaeum sp.]
MNSANNDKSNNWMLPINIVNLLFNTVTIIPFVIIPLYATTVLGASLFQASLIAGTFFGVNAVTAIIMGSLSDIMGKRKPFLIFSLFGSAVIFLIISFIALPVTLILLMGLFGFIAAGFSPCAMGMVSEYSEPGEKGKNLGYLNSGTSLGWAVGSFSSGTITELFSFAMTFYFGCMLAVLAAVLTIIFLRETKTDIVKERNFSKIILALKNRFIPKSGESTYLKEKGLSWFYISLFFRYSAYWGSFALLSIFFATIVSTTWVGILIAINLGISALIMSPVGKFSDMKGRKIIIMFGLIGTSIVLVMYATSYSLILLIIAQVLNAFVFASIYTGGSAFVSDVAPSASHNEAMGYLNSAITFGAVTGTLIAGIMAEIFGLRIMFLILAILPIIGAVIVLSKVSETISSS